MKTFYYFFTGIGVSILGTFVAVYISEILFNAPDEGGAYAFGWGIFLTILMTVYMGMILNEVRAITQKDEDDSSRDD